MFNSSGVSTIVNYAIFTTTNSVSVLVCLLAAILVFRLKLYRKLVYRLALYQVLSALAFALFCAMQVVLINYYESPNTYAKICTAIGYLVLYTQWMKLLFTMWVMFHLFCFAVLHKNLQKLELFYVVTSLLVPVVIAAVPLASQTYGMSPSGSGCFVYAANKSRTALIERLALWDGPAMIMLIVASIAMFVMVIKLARQVCRKWNYEPISDDDQFTKALKQLLPLATFPILFFLFEIPVFIIHVYTTHHSTTMTIFVEICISLWSMASGATLMIHISVTQMYGKKYIKPRDTSHVITQNLALPIGSQANSSTRFSLPPPSV